MRQTEMWSSDSTLAPREERVDLLKLCKPDVSSTDVRARPWRFRIGEQSWAFATDGHVLVGVLGFGDDHPDWAGSGNQVVEASLTDLDDPDRDSRTVSRAKLAKWCGDPWWDGKTCEACKGDYQSVTCDECRGSKVKDVVKCEICNHEHPCTCSACDGTGTMECGDCDRGRVWAESPGRVGLSVVNRVLLARALDVVAGRPGKLVRLSSGQSMEMVQVAGPDWRIALMPMRWKEGDVEEFGA